MSDLKWVRMKRSSDVAAYAWEPDVDKRQGWLWIEFVRGGRIYKYYVDRDLYEGFKSSGSKGQYVHSVLYNTYYEGPL